MSDVLEALLADLAAEVAALRAVVERAGDDGWTTPTPAPGWSVATQVAHLAWTDHAALLAARHHHDPAPWDELVAVALADVEHFVDDAALAWAARPRAEVLTTWSEGASALVEALRAVPAGEKLPWFGPPMAPASMATARFMETWAHGLDVREGLGVSAEPNDRVRHVVHLGVRTRGFSYATHGRTPPSSEVRLELTAPSGETWTWGPDDAPAVVTGSAWDFARLVTQRVHRDDTDLTTSGPAAADAEDWLAIAQAFAGPPGTGRGPR